MGYYHHRGRGLTLKLVVMGREEEKSMSGSPPGWSPSSPRSLGGSAQDLAHSNALTGFSEVRYAVVGVRRQMLPSVLAGQS